MEFGLSFPGQMSWKVFETSTVIFLSTAELSGQADIKEHDIAVITTTSCISNP
jgi:hypothetical protein